MRCGHTTKAGLIGLVNRDRSLPGLDVLLDSERLSAALDRDVRITRVRYKPGASVVVAFCAAATATVTSPQQSGGWAASYANDDKPAKTLAKSSPAAPVRRIAALPHAVTGSPFSDRALGAPLDFLRAEDAGGLSAARILRHNPHRRMLLEISGRVVKVSANDAAPVDLTTHLHRGVALLVPEVRAPGVSSTVRWGVGDLSVAGDSAHAALAGSALAELHRPLVQGPAPTPLEDEVAHAITGLTAIDPAFAASALRIAARVPSLRTSAFVHGDFTADQVLTGDGVRLIDFDRSGPGDPHRDLGSFVAGEWMRTGGSGHADALLSGYRAAGGTVRETALREWTAICLLLRASEPFRASRIGWHDEIAAGLAYAQRVAA